MTIIKNSAYLRQFPFQYLSPNVAEAMRTAVSGLEGISDTMLKTLECYCHLLGIQISYLTLSTPAFGDIVNGFLGALNGTALTSVQIQGRRRYGMHLEKILKALKPKIPGLYTFHWDPYLLEKYAPIWDGQCPLLSKSTIQYWNSWKITARKGAEVYLDLSCLWNSHGKQFTSEIYGIIGNYYAKQARPSFVEFNKMARFLSSNVDKWPVETFHNPIEIERFFKAYMLDHFQSAVREKLNLQSQAKAWSNFISNMTEAFIESGEWATPFEGSLPKPVVKSIPGSLTRISRTADGVEVKDKLITSVPLQITDDEAIEILFKTISSDLNVVKRWARSQAYTIRKAQLRRVHLAKAGTPILGGSREKKAEDFNFSDLSATFEYYGFTTENSINAKLYGTERTRIAKILGLPTVNSLYPFQCLLVTHHPKITFGFFDKFKLYNRAGQRSGFLKTDTGYLLVGYKDRRGKELSEQKIKLNPRSAALVRQVIEITAPLREFLKSKGDERWRELFLTCGAGFSSPLSAKIPQWNRAAFTTSTGAAELIRKQFEPFIQLRNGQLNDFLYRVDLSSIRASRGVEIYIETQNATKMALALGHASYSVGAD